MKRKVKREIIEWVLLSTIIGVVYFGGWHKDVIGRIQQVVLETGIISPKYLDGEKEVIYDFWLEDMKGNRISFAEFEGKVTFVNFWATWCPPCIAEMPDINGLYKERGHEVSFVMISLDQDELKAHDFVAKKSFDFPTFFLRSSLPNTFDPHSIPTTYLIDKEGKIRVEKHGMAKYNTKKFNQTLTSLLKAQNP